MMFASDIIFDVPLALTLKLKDNNLFLFVKMLLDFMSVVIFGHEISV